MALHRDAAVTATREGGMRGRSRLAGIVSAGALAAAGMATSGAVADEHFTFHTPAVVHGGSEEVLVGGAGPADVPGTAFDVPHQYWNVHSFSVSDDGSMVWLTIHDRFESPVDSAWQVWAVPTAGGSAQQIDVPALPESGGDLQVSTSEDGTAAWMSVSYSRGSGPLPLREFQFYRASLTSGSFELLWDTADEDQEEDDYGGGVPTHLQSTDDGDSVLWAVDQYIWRLDVGSPTPFRVAQRDDITYNGEPPRFGFSGLDITHNGGEPATKISVWTRTESSPEGISDAFVIPLVGSTQFEAVGDPDSGTYSERVEAINIDDLGENVAYCTGQFGERRCWVGEQGGVHREVERASDRIDGVVLSDDGQTLYTHIGHHGAATYWVDVVEDALTGVGRVAAHPGHRQQANATGVKLSDDAAVAIAPIDVRTDGTHKIGLWMLHNGTFNLPDFPQMSNARWAYNGDDEIVVRVDVSPATTDGTIDRVGVTFLLDGWIDPVRVLDEADNPFYGQRFGKFTFAPIEGDPDTYEFRANLGGKRDKLDDHDWTIRLEAWDDTIQRTTFVDIPLVPDPTPAVVPAGFDGDPATTERVAYADATVAALAISAGRFTDADASSRTAPSHNQTAPRNALHVVLTRDDAFPDSLAGAPLTADGPMLFTDRSTLDSSTRDEIDRVLRPGGRVYLLGGTAALSQGIEDELAAAGYDVQRLWGSGRVETSVAIADEVRRLFPGPTRAAVARAFAPETNPTAAWADAVTGGAYGAFAGVPILITPTESLHPAVDAWLQADDPSETVLFGGQAALSAAVEAAVPFPRRVSGAARHDTAAAIATELWRTQASGSRRFVVIDGYQEDGWMFGMASAGLAADESAPMLMVHPDATPDATRALVRSSTGSPEVDLLLVGDDGIISEQRRAELDAEDGG